MSGIGALSDRRAKENIKAVGKTFDGQTVYSYNYKGHPATEIGLIAQPLNLGRTGAKTQQVQFLARGDGLAHLAYELLIAWAELPHGLQYLGQSLQQKTLRG